ncbi:hypothetical protein OOK41_01340 [Micromonospora sp. NBC_01655]|uniref:hypothetical protein n=1 Tax=Micromonospora sp. NBC_01655 TaxID=2975983 RepID=UPI00224F93B8|nr:hypothetical protein [Micromonospora sp. NBC_01655]MCX4468968.1 hypothetical protein [Micromonospora sp. NBC_01655]
MDVVEVRPDPATFRRVAAALDAEADGRQWRRELATELHAALAPGVDAARAAILAMPGGLPHAGEPLRQAIAAAVVSEIRLTGAAGARIRVRKRGMPRNFPNAPRRTNARRGWRHPVFSPDVWVTQRGEPGWFDDTLLRRRPAMRAAAEKALQARARRIARRN